MNELSPGAATHGAWTPDGETEPKLGEEAVIDAIATVYDPEIPVNIYELGLVYAVDVHDDGRVKVEMTLTAPACPSAQELPEQVREAVLGGAWRDRLRGRDGVGSAVGSQPHERGSPAAVEYVLTNPDLG